MTPEEQYPSTQDCAPMLGAQDDAVLLCMQNARDRVEQCWTRGCYISRNGAVCAVGAVYVQDVDRYEVTIGPNGADLYHAIEHQLRDEAKEAIRLLNEATVELHPESEGHVGLWQGPLEWLNQEWYAYHAGEGSDLDADAETATKTEVLRVYDHAIALRAGEPVPA